MLEVLPLANGHVLHACWLPDRLKPDELQLWQLWALRPQRPSFIRIHGRYVAMPRWQQVYGADYHFTGSMHPALPVPAEFHSYLDWGRAEIEPRLNGVVVNWYDAALGHYIGKHRDSTRRMCLGAPIVMISMGAPRTLRMRPWRGRGTWDFPTSHGRVYVLPYETNLAWTHEVPLFASDEGERISITLRAFEPV